MRNPRGGPRATPALHWSVAQADRCAGELCLWAVSRADFGRGKKKRRRRREGIKAARTCATIGVIGAPQEH